MDDRRKGLRPGGSRGRTRRSPDRHGVPGLGASVEARGDGHGRGVDARLRSDLSLPASGPRSLSRFVVAIDGPAGAGKTATARGVAERLGLVHVDSGAMYRAVGWLARERGASLDSETGLLELLKNVRIEAGREGLLVNGASVEPHIRTADAGEAASRVAVHPGVRARL